MMASPEFLKSLPQALIKPSMLETLRETRCTICLEDFNVGNKVTLLPCCHLYHTKCILAGLRVNNTCPLCRREFPKAERQPVEEPQRRRRQRHSSRDVFMMWFTPEVFPNASGGYFTTDGTRGDISASATSYLNRTEPANVGKNATTFLKMVSDG